jgi:nucleotide-binding universal stress UspA family protein
MIVVGVDNSAGAKEALRFALEEARLRDTTLRAVHSWRYGYIGGSGLQANPVLVGAGLNEAREAAEAELDATMEEVVGDYVFEVRIERRVVEGRPAQVLVDESRDSELLVVGSRGLGGFGGLLLGSVSQQCAQHAACPVVIVRAVSDESRSDYERAA